MDTAKSWDFLNVETRMDGDKIIGAAQGMLGAVLQPFVDHFYGVRLPVPIEVIDELAARKKE